jgi:Cys-rich protein (TIGR01571 family)
MEHFQKYVASFLTTSLLSFCTFDSFVLVGNSVAWGCIYDAATHSKSGFCWKIMLTLVVVYFTTLSTITSSTDTDDGVLSFFLRALGLTIIIITALIRGTIRRKYNIRGSCFGDCICNYFLGCCTAIQAYQQLETSHEHPKLIRNDECNATLLAPQVV